MSKVKKMRLCDWSLVVATVLMLASSIQLEATGGSSGRLWVWLHIIMGCCFIANIVWHLYLHFSWKSWLQRLWKQKSPVTRWLAILSLLTAISAVVVLFHWTGSYTHSPIGGVHGKIGFVFLFLAIYHTIKRISFFQVKH